MKFDWTINLGTVITVVGTLIAMGIGYMNLVRRIDRIEYKLDQVFRWFEAHVIRINGGVDG